MFFQLKKLIKDCLTENDGQSYDVTRVIVALVGTSGFPTFLGCTIYSVWSNPDHHFDMQSFGISMCAMLTGLCAAAIGIGQKQRTDTDDRCRDSQ
jgi:hypothetical protein